MLLSLFEVKRKMEIDEWRPRFLIINSTFADYFIGLACADSAYLYPKEEGLRACF